MALSNKDVNAMVKLGGYYNSIKNYKLMKKYYLMAIEHENVDAMINLGDYYRNVEKNCQIKTQ
jgi:TPR repeat protein